MNQVMIIVDGYRASLQTPVAFNEEGVDCIHVQSMLKVPKALGKIDEKEYIETIVYDDNLDALVQHLTTKYPNRIIGAMAGLCAGVKLADELSEALNCPTANGTEKSSARYDKWDMVETLKKEDVQTVTHFKSDNLDEIKNFITSLPEHGEAMFPVVLKPRDSAGSVGVSICYDTDDVVKAYHELMDGGKTIFDKKNDTVLAQAFLHGTEYVVNAVCCGGNIIITDMWQYYKQDLNGKYIYDYEDALGFDRQTLIDHPERAEMIAYVKSVIKALGIRYGIIHAEVKYTPRGAVLVEIAQRMSGGVRRAIFTDIFGIDPILMTVYAYANPEKFKQYYDEIERNGSRPLNKHARLAILASEQTGIIQKLPFVPEEMQQNCTSIAWVVINYNVGDRLKLTVDLVTNVGRVFFVHKDLLRIQLEHQYVKNVVKNEFKLFDVTSLLQRYWANRTAPLVQPLSVTEPEKKVFSYGN